MSLTCGVECVVVLGCLRWAWKRCTYIGSDDSASWTVASPEEFDPVPRVCRVILAVYDPDLDHPQYSPPGGYRIDPASVLKRVTYEQTQGRAPPYIIYLDSENKEIVLAIRGLNLAKESDYKLLLDNRLGRQMFDGGYVHHGLLKSALWILGEEGEYLRRIWEENGREYDMVFAGHSLGSGVAALLTVIAVNRRELLGGIPREKIRCFAVAPARCMSLNLAVKYADVIHSVVLQDDFLPRTPTPLEDIFKSIFWLNFAILQHPFGFQLPWKHFHNGCGRYPPEVRTAIPVDGRFEHIVLSCNVTSDHAIIWIVREAEKALERMKEISSETRMTAMAPKVQKMGRLQSLEKEHKDAMERAVSLNIPHAAVSTPDAEPAKAEPCQHKRELDQKTSTRSEASANWDEVVKVLFKKSEPEEVVVNQDVNIPK